MAKYNIYKIDKTKEAALIEKLEAVGLSQSGQKTIDGFTLSFYLSQEPEAIDIWWTDLYAEYLGTDEKPKNKAYFAVFLISNNSLLYAISMGKSHFYLKDFCDTDFGINLAERIAEVEEDTHGRRPVKLVSAKEEIIGKAQHGKRNENRLHFA